MSETAVRCDPRKHLKREARELEIKQRHIALTLEYSDTTVSNFLNGVKLPPEDVLKKILFIYSFVRSEHMRVGHFRFDRAGIKPLRRKIREMQRSEVKPAQPVSNAAAVEESSAN